MQIGSINPWRPFVHLGAIVAVGSLAGAILAGYATDGGLLQQRWAETERPVLGNPDALVADRHPIPIGTRGPAYLVCSGCGPGINEQRAIEAQRRLDALISRNANSTESYGDHHATSADYGDGYDDRTAGRAKDRAGERDGIRYRASHDATASADLDREATESANASIEMAESGPIDAVDFESDTDTASEQP